MLKRSSQQMYSLKAILRPPGLLTPATRQGLLAVHFHQCPKGMGPFLGSANIFRCVIALNEDICHQLSNGDRIGKQTLSVVLSCKLLFDM